MSRYMKRFVYASLFYLGSGALIGVLEGTVNLGYFGTFAHTHFNLLGFMAMIVFGIGYFILPRFNGSELRYESWVPVHFWLANVSLIGMVLFRWLALETGSTTYYSLFIAFASIQVLSILMFVVNIWVSLTPAKKTAESPAPIGQGRTAKPGSFEVADEKSIKLNAGSSVAFLVDTLPSLKDVLIECGLTPLAMPGHLDRVRANEVTLGMAVRNHGLDLDKTIAAVTEELARNGFAIDGAANTRTGGAANLSASTLIGEVIRNYPGTREVFLKHFGSGCFDCPGQAYESIDMACRMHGVDTELFLRELAATAR